MTRPEQGLDRARAEAARKRAERLYGEEEPNGIGASIAEERPGFEQLAEWAQIEVEPEAVYSTRRGGGVIVALKRLLLRLLRQYLVELEGRQTRFNVALLEHVRELDRRVSRLESGAVQGGPPGDRE